MKLRSPSTMHAWQVWRCRLWLSLRFVLWYALTYGSSQVESFEEPIRTTAEENSASSVVLSGSMLRSRFFCLSSVALRLIGMSKVRGTLSFVFLCYFWFSSTLSTGTYFLNGSMETLDLCLKVWWQFLTYRGPMLHLTTRLRCMKW